MTVMEMRMDSLQNNILDKSILLSLDTMLLSLFSQCIFSVSMSKIPPNKTNTSSASGRMEELQSEEEAPGMPSWEPVVREGLLPLLLASSLPLSP